MGRFARDSRREVVNRKQPQRQTWKGRDTPNYRAPIELKYFVMALAALIGLGVGWLSGKAITGWLPSTTPPPAVADRDATPTSEDAGERLQAALSAVSPEVATTQEAVADAAASPEPDASAEPMVQATTDDSQTRADRKVARRVYIRRHARGNIFFRPFKALRKLRIW